MKLKYRRFNEGLKRFSWLLLWLLCTATTSLRSQTVSLTFQGTLKDPGGKADRSYDWRFIVYDGPKGGQALSEPVTNAATRLTNGLFTTTFVLDQNALRDHDAWIDVAVRPAGSTGEFTVFGSRHQINTPPAPSTGDNASPQASTPPASSTGTSPLAQLSKKQAELLKTARTMLAAQKNAPASAMQSAAEALQNANNAVGPLAAGALGQMPSGAQSALQSAQGSASKGSAQAQAGQNSPAQQSAAAAAQALAQAQAALALAQAGVGSEAAQQGQGQGQGQGKGQAKGKGQGQGQGQGQAQANAQGQGQPNPQGDGNRGNWNGTGGADGARNAATGSSSFLRLPSRDRAALQQSQAEKYPQEYGPLVEQYLRNLSDQATEK